MIVERQVFRYHEPSTYEAINLVARVVKLPKDS